MGTEGAWEKGMTTRAANARQAIELTTPVKSAPSFNRTARECELHGANVERMPDTREGARCAIAYFKDGSHLEFSDVSPLGHIV
jgi:hypothetical protein